MDNLSRLSILISKDGIVWNNVKHDKSDNITPYYCVSSKEKRIVVIGDQKIYTTYDFNKWDEDEKSNIIDKYTQIVYNRKYYLLTGNTMD